MDMAKDDRTHGGNMAKEVTWEYCKGDCMVRTIHVDGKCINCGG